MGSCDDFFAERTDQSEVKSRIVAKFFASWSSVIVGTAKRFGRKPSLAYIDLFSGPGRYIDGAKSTPLMVMEHVIATPDLAVNMQATFNDKDPSHIASLSAALEGLPGYATLGHKPTILCGEIDDSVEEIFAKRRMVPTMSFIDPYGYKGLTAKLIRAIGKDWGSDCIFFFNYRRINAAIPNDNFRKHMNALFGVERVERMRAALGPMRGLVRIEYIMRMLAEALREEGFRHSLAFRFKDDNGTRTTHALVYVAKDPKGYGIMKNIMAAESSTFDHGVPSFVYDPSYNPRQSELDLSNPIEDLALELALAFNGQRRTFKSLFDEHHLDTLYIEKNYKQAINYLEERDMISVEPPAIKRVRGGMITCGPNTLITFKTRSGE